MFTHDEPELIHEIPFRTSGSSGPRNRRLPVYTVRYENSAGPQPTILATADLQGREKESTNRLLGELLADEIERLQQAEDLPALDLCLLCGDFYDYPDLNKLGGTGDVTSAFNALARIASETAAVLGNHDELNPHELLTEVRVLDGKTFHSRSFTIGGVSGILGNPRKNNRKTEEEFLTAIEHCTDRCANVLLFHQGPQGNGPQQAGLDLINAALEPCRDLLVLCGHCHWDEPFHQEGQNLFCNVDGRVLIFLPR
ncbi:metallophosphoesterase family protein [Anatilimnocola floriformis]|uniref:metallophosphoesterase family protein n=1 Tax=Anatilimnocola floriformis TaxID=2948575 RepID=UPI0020C510CF|nr:metallophosphoesterase [Anatilimnocola floriformis]